MPRVHRRGHKQRGEYGALTREELIRALTDDVNYPDVDSPFLKHLPEAERAALVDDALRLFYSERAARRRVELRERLTTSSVYGWASIFCEAPELEEELTGEQRQRWQGYLKGTRPPEPSSGKVLTMPRPS